MNIRKFKKEINAGRGSAILALKNGIAQGDDRYKDAVLYACLHDTCYDAQGEPYRCDYLFEAITLTGDTDYFENKIIEKLYKVTYFRIHDQLTGLLYLFHKNGSKKAGVVLQNRFDDLIIKLPRIRVYHYTPRESAENIAIWLFKIYGIKSFIESAKKIGGLLLKTGYEYVIFYDDFLSEAKEKFGEERINELLKKEAEKSEEVKYLFDVINADNDNSENSGKNYKGDTITLQDVISWVDDPGRRWMNVYIFGNRLARNSTPKELNEIADLIETTDNLRLKLTLISVFRIIDYPKSVDKLFEFYENGETEEIKRTTLEALGRFEDKRIHDLAIYNLQNDLYVEDSLDMLKNNFQGEYEIILNALKSYKAFNKYSYHSLTMAIKHIFENITSPEMKEILLFDYHKNRCASCREFMIKKMCETKCIPENILEECLYDSHTEIRKIATKYKKQNVK